MRWIWSISFCVGCLGRFASGLLLLVSQELATAFAGYSVEACSSVAVGAVSPVDLVTMLIFAA